MKIDLTLPMPAETFIPHRMPMRLVDTLVSFGDAAGVVEAKISDDCIFVDAEGFLDEAALVEIMAQTYAAIKGYADLQQGDQISRGYLVGIRKLRITGRARAGELLVVRIRTIGSFEGFAVAKGEIERGAEILASGSIKLWIVDEERAA